MMILLILFSSSLFLSQIEAFFFFCAILKIPKQKAESFALYKAFDSAPFCNFRFPE